MALPKYTIPSVFKLEMVKDDTRPHIPRLLTRVSLLETELETLRPPHCPPNLHTQTFDRESS